MNTTSKPNLSKKSKWAVRILTALVILPFAMSAFMKLSHSPEVIHGFTGAGIPLGAIVPIAVVELSCLALFLIRRTVVLGTLLLTGYLGGAIMANMVMHSDFIHCLAVGLMVWAGAWLRVPELRSLLPIRDEEEPLAASRRTATRERLEDYSVVAG